MQVVGRLRRKSPDIFCREDRRVTRSLESQKPRGEGRSREDWRTVPEASEK